MKKIKNKIIEILIIFIILFCLSIPILMLINFIKNNIEIKELKQKINELKFEQEYLDFVYQDSIKQ